MKTLGIFVVIFSFLFSFSIFAANFDRFNIVDIDYPRNSNENILVFASNGLVYELNDEKSDLLDEIEYAKSLKQEIDTNVIDLENGRKEIKSVQFINEFNHHSKITSENDENSQGRLEATYITDMKSETDIIETFDSMKYGMRGRSQCYNRAMVWGWELFHNTYLGEPIQIGKAWVFFTKKYIRNYNYKWWFHIAPYLTVKKSPRVLDRTFTKGPKTVQEWTDQFVKTQQVCPVIEKYSQYSQNQETSDCYLMKTSMHYWQPFQLEDLETNNTQRSEYIFTELKKAYRNALGLFAKVPYWD